MSEVVPRRDFVNCQRFVAKCFWSAALIVGLVGMAMLPWPPPAHRLALGILTLAGVLLLPAAVCQFLVVPRVERFLDALRRGDYLAHWEYSETEWANWKRQSESLWRTPVRERQGEAFLSVNGVYLDGHFQSWKLSFHLRLESVDLRCNDLDYIEIVYRGGRSLHTIRVPVPEGKGDEARRVVRELRSKGR